MDVLQPISLGYLSSSGHVSLFINRESLYLSHVRNVALKMIMRSADILSKDIFVDLTIQNMSFLEASKK